MSSRRENRRRNKKDVPAKLRMDTKPQTPRITDPSLPAGRRREIDNVMKKARAQKSPTSGVFWDKKLLEVEAKDPNRWRHSGYKSLYIDGSSSPSSSGRRSRSRSTAAMGRRSPRSPAMRRVSPFGRRSPRSPRSPPPRSSRSSSSPRRRSPAGYRTPMSARRSPLALSRSSRAGMRPRSPPSPQASSSARHGTNRRSLSNSSVSSCSDDSCSVCSPKPHRRVRSRSRSNSPPRSRKPPPRIVSPPPKTRARPRPPSPSPSPPRRMPRPMTPPPTTGKLVKQRRPSPSDKPTDPRRRPPPPRPRGITGEIINVKGVKPPPKPGTVKKPAEKSTRPMLLKRIKKERLMKRPGSPVAAESSGSEENVVISPSAIVATTTLSLSQRFGKIAQWSADRERRDLENMRITKTGSNMKVMVEDDEFLFGSPPRRHSLSPVPSGHFPDKLLSSSQSRKASWDDVRVRYQYYKDLGYLRDLTLDDYVKWEEWWYKYQDWLASERHYEHWLTTRNNVNRRRKKRIPISQRLN